MKISKVKLMALVMGASLSVSVIGLGLAGSSYTRGTTSSTALTAETQQLIKQAESDKVYNNLSHITLENLQNLIEAKSTFVLYTGTEGCVFCRVTLNVDSRLVTQAPSQYTPAAGETFFQKLESSFLGTGSGTLNDAAINSVYPVFAIHDTKYSTYGEYAASQDITNVANAVVNSNAVANSFRSVNGVPYTSATSTGTQVQLTSAQQALVGNPLGGISNFTTAYNYFDNAATIRFVETATTRTRRDSIVNNRSYGTPAIWGFVNGELVLHTAGYIYRKTLEAFAELITNGGTAAQIRAQIVTA